MEYYSAMKQNKTTNTRNNLHALPDNYTGQEKTNLKMSNFSYVRFWSKIKEMEVNSLGWT